MSLNNLCLLPLVTVDNLVSQKCLLPQDNFPQIGRIGQWAKCFFHDVDQKQFKNFAVCQIFPRNEDKNSVCYLDTSVCKFKPDNEEVELMLERVELLDDNEIELSDIHVSFCLNSEYCIQNIESLSQSYLKEMAHIMLQGYHFSSTCTVRGPEFQTKGVDEICINISGFEDQGIFIITDDTNVHIETVTLVDNPKKRDFVTFDVLPFNRVREQLNDLMDVVQMQRSHKRPLGISLNTLLVGSVGCGKTALIDDFLHNRRCNVFRVTTTNVIKQYPGETEAELRKIFKSAQYFERHFASKEPTVILLEDVHLLCPQTMGVGSNSEAKTNAMRILSQLLLLIDELFNSKSGILCLATTAYPDKFNELARRPGRFDREILIATLTSEDRNAILKELFVQTLPGGVMPPSQIFQLMCEQTQGYALADLTLLVRNVARTAITKSHDSFEVIVRESLRISQPMSIRGTDVTAYRTSESFDVIGGMYGLKRVLEVSVLSGLKRENAFRKFGLTLPKGVLLYGPPGCAKTTIAKCLATEANMTFIATSGAEVYSPYVGCAEKFLAKIFDTARKNSPCLIFLDEIDSLVGRRTVNASSGDVQMRILSTLLTEMDGIIGSSSCDGQRDNNHVLVVAATNRPDLVDDALMRPGRFDKLIHVPAPDRQSRRSILALYQQRMPFHKDVDLDKIAERTVKYSGADICNLCNEAAMTAFQRNFNSLEIQHEDFEYVLRTSSKSSLTQMQIDWYYEFETKFHR